MTLCSASAGRNRRAAVAVWRCRWRAAVAVAGDFESPTVREAKAALMLYVEQLRLHVSRGTIAPACFTWNSRCYMFHVERVRLHVSRGTGVPACLTWNSRTLVFHMDPAGGERERDRGNGTGRSPRTAAATVGVSRGAVMGGPLDAEPLERRAHRGGAQSTGEPRSVARVLGSSAPAPRCFTWNVRAPGVTSAPPSRNDGRRGTVAELAMRAGLTPLRGSARQRNVSRGTAPRTLSRVTLHHRNPGIHAAAHDTLWRDVDNAS